MPRPPPLTSATRPSSCPMCQPWPVTDGSRKAILAALFANLGIAIAKFVGFLITALGRPARRGRRTPSPTPATRRCCCSAAGGPARGADAEHPFGYGRERYFWAFVVALVLFSMGGLFALYEGISKLRDPHEVENLAVAIGILRVRHRPRVVLAAHGLPGGAAPQGATTCRGGRYIRTAKQPELPVVLLEDIGAEIGLFLALGGVLLAHFTGRASLGRRRLDRHRRAARRHRHPAGHRDEGPADRRGGVRHRRPDRSSGSLASAPQRAAPDQRCAPSTSARRAAGGGEGRVRSPDLSMEQLAAAINGAEEARAHRACRRPASCSSSPTSIRAT